MHLSLQRLKDKWEAGEIAVSLCILGQGHFSPHPSCLHLWKANKDTYLLMQKSLVKKWVSNSVYQKLRATERVQL